MSKNFEQLKAADPKHSVWVCASAGTGKTKILTDRVLRLLVQGVSYDKILCLTFTNVAASEMQERIYQRLRTWSISNHKILEQDLENTLGRPSTIVERSIANNLYYKLINFPKPLYIQTVHGFCQQLISNSAYEAGINSNFQIIDEIRLKEIIQLIKQQFYNSPTNQELIEFFTASLHDLTFTDLLQEIIIGRLRLQNAKLPKEKLKQLLGTLSRSEQINNIYAQLRTLQTDIVQDICVLKDIFLTATGTKRKKLPPLNSSGQNTNYTSEIIQSKLLEVQDLVYKLDQYDKLLKQQQNTKFFLQLVKVIIKLYQEYKQINNLLDYDDLINIAQKLLDNSNLRSQVLLKLSQFEHVLVDEAQDTSPVQWQIIKAITTDFFASNNDINQTVFVVGDEKQSIFSFQGADLESFRIMQKYFSQKCLDNSISFEDITLKYCYRSTHNILQTVYNLFANVKAKTPRLFEADNPEMIAYRSASTGIVDRWPLIESEKTNSELFWPLPEEYLAATQTNSAKKILSQQIADFIATQINQQIIIPTTGKPATPGDFMILVRKRDELIKHITDALKERQIKSNDLDRIKLQDSIIIQELCSIAKFVLKPNDDLNLALLLKSPIFSIAEEELQFICQTKKRDSIWHFFNNYLSDNKQITAIVNKLKLLQNIYFTVPTSRFFAVIIDQLNFRSLLRYYEGNDCNDLINELLYISSEYMQTIDSSLQSFIDWVENNELEIKRDISGKGQVRIMTVHSSKGLQAPIVILCDTTGLPTSNEKITWLDKEHLLIALQASETTDMLKDVKAYHKQKQLAEYLRLLYVAMTRAEDHLIICGYKNQVNLAENCWYDLVTRVVPETLITPQTVVLQKAELAEEIKGQEIQNELSNARFIFTDNYYNNNLETQTLEIENLEMQNPEIQREDFRGRNDNFYLPNDLTEYGIIFHKILEYGFNKKNFTDLINDNLVTQLIGKLALTLQNKLRHKIASLAEHPEIIQLLQQELKTEVNIGIMQEYGPKTARIDLLAKNSEIITIIDFKSTLTPPNHLEKVAPEYKEQMAFYKYAIIKLYPNHIVNAKILWLETLNFMNIA